MINLFKIFLRRNNLYMKKIVLLFAVFTLTSCGEESKDYYKPKPNTQNPQKQKKLGTIEPAIWSKLKTINSRFDKTLNFRDYSPGFCINLGYTYALAQNSLKSWEPIDGQPDELHEIRTGRDRLGTVYDEAFLFLDCASDPEYPEKFEGEKAIVSFTAAIPTLFAVMTSQAGIGLRVGSENENVKSLESIAELIRNELRTKSNSPFEHKAQNACARMGILADALKRQGRDDSILWSACDKNVAFDHGFGIESALNTLNL